MTSTEFYAVMTIYAALLVVIFGLLRSQISSIARQTTKELSEMNKRIEKVACEVAEVESRSRTDLDKVLTRIETKIDNNEEKSAHTRHEIRDQVNGLKLRLEVAIAQGAIGKSQESFK